MNAFRASFTTALVLFLFAASGVDAYVHGPEVLYARPIGKLTATPEDSPRGGGGFGQWGPACPLDTSVPPAYLPCWSWDFEGAAQASHVAGDPAHLSMWMQGTHASTKPLVLEAWLEANGTPVAEGQSEPFAVTPGTTVPGYDFCTLVEVDLPLAADVPGGSALVLVLRADGLFGSDCYGGYEDGNRLTIG